MEPRVIVRQLSREKAYNHYPSIGRPLVRDADGFSDGNQLAPTTETEDKMEGALLLDVVIREGATILELFTSENETLLIGGDTFLVLNLALDVVDRVTGLDLEGN
jgi:hypothetical protein